MLDTLWPHGLQHARPPCPWPTPRACSNSCPSSQWCHPAILSSCHPLFLLTSIFTSIRVFSSELALHVMWPKYWSFSFSFSPFNEYSGLISLRIDSFDLLAVQGTLKSLLQHHSSKASVLRRSVFLMVQLSHPYMTAGKTIALTVQIFVSKVTSLLFNMFSRFVIVFLPRTKCILVAAVTVCRDFGAQENEIWHYFPKYPPGKLACHTEHAYTANILLHSQT